MKRFYPILSLVVFTAEAASAQAPPPGAIPEPVTAAAYQELLERPPFRRHLSLSDALVLSGVASLPAGKLVTVWNRDTGESFVVTASPNAQGWKLVEVNESADLRRVSATIEAGAQRLTVRFDPTRLNPPKLDNTSKPGARSESQVVIEALLRSLDPAAAREFESLEAKPQEEFRKAFADFLDAYPTAPDSRRLAFARQALEEVQRSRQEGATSPAPEEGGAAASPSVPAPVPEPAAVPTSSSAPE